MFMGCFTCGSGDAISFTPTSINDITYVGDSRYDALFAENCGCEYFLFEYGYDKKEIIHKFNPKAFLSKPTDLLKYF